MIYSLFNLVVSICPKKLISNLLDSQKKNISNLLGNIFKIFDLLAISLIY